MKFASGVVANLTYSGYAHFDTDEFTGWQAESGVAKGRSWRGSPGARRETYRRSRSKSWTNAADRTE